MRASLSKLRFRSGVLLALAGAVNGRAQLATSSPFLAPQAQATNAAAANSPLEFSGYMDVPGGDRLFRIKDPARKTSEWVKLNEKSPGLDVTVKQYDDSRRALVVEHQGKTVTLAEKESKIVSAGTVPQPVIAMPVANTMPAAVTQAVVTNPTPADEQRRLEAVAAEVARRRALREQATQQANQAQSQMGAQPGMMTPNNFQPDPQNQPNAQKRGQGGIRQNTRQQR
jgi:hypothetical protein